MFFRAHETVKPNQLALVADGPHHFKHMSWLLLDSSFSRQYLQK
jgi:hypothetical protein